MKKVIELRSKGLNDTEVVKELEKENMFFDPLTGDRGIGRRPTPEELKYLPNRLNRSIYQTPYSELNNNTINGYAGNMGILGHTTGTQTNVVFSTSQRYRQIEGWMKPGSLAVMRGGTYRHLITTHATEENYAGDWEEAGIVSWANEDGSTTNYMLFTYTNIGDSWAFHGTVSSTSDVKLRIEIGVYDFYYQGYPYRVYFNDNWFRTVYINRYNAIFDQSNEAWRSSEWDPYTVDTSHSIFHGSYLKTTDGTIIPWNNQIDDYSYWAPYFNCPMGSSWREDQPGPTWTFESWVNPNN
ncbi:hypothetical protein MCP_1519 [Methanocella paludicola SANAE]|uniref:Uncharacterized protein n=1 Tax=Methanocella paludicola (strain DSM 17711 / JCM 13418 / NBRC 101707 / SANAE) TaxID=304371 RepID=D1YYR9_METPS|nr:hypothetical protein [Methanocella paludicola]BAI61591.1 hypothetical protein MCP_1519 [Methanocella paludicola SANAE]